ncbi:hypothetical protein [Paenibacillus sp. MMS20-IR301]|uniref:hypothetical protein n=1 Tax=Paenibacillus sp. MMS20-IR301 TaxID=2895946 RepID=UPI0028E74D06|nr:hypothetical protein [Paenibacillus sp. MMS20-IR301]WNS44916.1 hypothetical protein LOS79_06495 [Paenibacillus sp. MMS20-IR301]
MLESVIFPVLVPNPGVVIAMHALKSTETQAVPLLVLNEEGELWRLELHSGLAVKLLQVDIPEFNPLHPQQIVLSKDERYAAISNRLGQHAAVYDLQSLQEVMKLSRDDYHYTTCTFPLAFAELDHRTVLIKGTEWNRLDLVDMDTGALLTDRESPVYESEDKQATEHYLDYFFGKLHVSPDGEWIISTGWIWQPVGSIRAWHLPSWKSNCWEAEDGPTVHNIWEYTEDWDYPVTWIDDYTFAVWGKIETEMYDEEDGELEIYGDGKSAPVLALFDVKTGERKEFFLKMPAIRLTSDIEGLFYPHAQMAQVHGKLVLWGAIHGLSILNPDSGHIEYSEQTSRPDLYHESAGLFLLTDVSGSITGLKLNQ